MLFKKRKQQEFPEVVEGEYVKPPKQPMSKAKKIFIAAMAIIMVFVVGSTSCYFGFYYVKKDYSTVSSFVTLPDPVQEETSGEFKVNVYDNEVLYKKRAKYTLTGLVVEKHYYLPYKFQNKICRYDFGVVWGPLLDADLEEEMTFKNDGQRFLHYTYKYSLVKKLGSEEAIVNSLSNNHTIHANNHILKCFRNIKEGDYIKFEGYLVDAYYTSRSWTTSLVRTDHGDGACEVFYVTNVTWLKTK